MGKRPWIFVTVLAIGVAIAVVVVASTADTETPIGLGVLPIPAIGATEPGELHDGHPVFVAHDVDGTLTVVDAVSTHLPDDPMAWCEESRTIDDMAHSARWDAQGRYVAGPAQTDLGTYEYAVDERSHKIVVLMFVAPSGRTQSPVATPHFCEDQGEDDT